MNSNPLDLMGYTIHDQKKKKKTKFAEPVGALTQHILSS